MLLIDAFPFGRGSMAADLAFHVAKLRFHQIDTMGVHERVLVYLSAVVGRRIPPVNLLMQSDLVLGIVHGIGVAKLVLV